MRILVMLGTRPEAIKLAPLVLALRAPPGRFDVRVCVTGQHRDLVAGALGFFGVAADRDLDVMTPDQGLGELTGRLVPALCRVMAEEAPDRVIVQGDTTTAFCGALAAFYERRPVAHVEAGLRSGDVGAPFPEEMNRVMAARLADLHFAPTERARRNLAAEGVTAGVHVVGNTGLDALRLARAALALGARPETPEVRPGERLVLATVHRRELTGEALEAIALALRDTARRFADVRVVVPVHPSPRVQAMVRGVLGAETNVTLAPPLDYPALIALLERAHVVVTDSGGLQEEAPAVGRPVLVTREATERPEGIDAGTARLVGTDRGRIAGELARLLEDEEAWRAMARVALPYGDGYASERIRDVLSR